MTGLHSLHRRQFLAGLATVGAAAIGSTLRAQAPGASARRIDVHHHFASPGWLTALRSANILPPNWNDWTPARAIEALDSSGTAMAIASITTPGIWFGEGYGNDRPPSGQGGSNDARALARETNEYGARLVSDHKGRYGLWAALPLMDVDGSLKETEYALGTLDGHSFDTCSESAHS